MSSQASGDLATILGRNIRAARGELDLTQRQVAVKLGVDSMLVSKWERGWHRPSDENLIALAGLFKCDVGWLYTNHDSVAA